MATYYIIQNPHHHNSKDIKTHITLDNVINVKTETVKLGNGYLNKTTIYFEHGSNDYTYNHVSNVLPKNSIDVTNLTLLPFFADVIEDIPQRFKPTLYKRAQLMVERRGLYQFYKHPDKKEPLLIAVNSNVISKYHLDSFQITNKF